MYENVSNDEVSESTWLQDRLISFDLSDILTIGALKSAWNVIGRCEAWTSTQIMHKIIIIRLTIVNCSKSAWTWLMYTLSVAGSSDKLGWLMWLVGLDGAEGLLL